MTDNFTGVYLDSCVYLDDILGDNPDRLDVSRTLLERAQLGVYRLVASTLVYAEVAGNGPYREMHGTARLHAEQKIDAFFEQGLIRYVEVDLLVARKGRDLSRRCGLRGPDAVHLASAIRAGCDAFMTWNSKDFGRLYGQQVEGVLVVEPHLWGQEELFGGDFSDPT